MDVDNLKRLLGNRCSSFTDEQLTKLAGFLSTEQQLLDLSDDTLSGILALPAHDLTFRIARDAIQGWKRERQGAL